MASEKEQPIYTHMVVVPELILPLKTLDKNNNIIPCWIHTGDHHFDLYSL
ncbi:hypothetical protein MtrunA17_Chr4g0049301 [Medicago truncatula]|uniref:Uncharacterized protein n=1 Tax=Medicago truncatula TaxID=3880 RepID=A0A396IAJ2_MEDTR|nr:hypothetical protein MtrunA17_Chr4g0049301 [Medicago truncatula]